MGGAPTGGFNILLTSNVPHGAGMSNSAANCVALGLVFNALYPLLNISKTIELVTFARCSENSKFAGGQCGWLDQLLIAESEEGKKECKGGFYFWKIENGSLVADSVIFTLVFF